LLVELKDGMLLQDFVRKSIRRLVSGGHRLLELLHCVSIMCVRVSANAARTTWIKSGDSGHVKWNGTWGPRMETRRYSVQEETNRRLSLQAK
jgi:hypothetical protein